MREDNATVPESIVTDLAVAHLDAEREAGRHQGLASGHLRRANYAREHAQNLEWVKGYMAPRVGRPWDEVRAELAADLDRVNAEAATAQEALHEAQERHRDAVGVVRWLKQRCADLQDKADPGETP